MPKCKIQWIDKSGQPTPDDNEAIGLARCKGRVEQRHGRAIQFTESEWFPICACHAKQLDDAGMEIWEFKAIEVLPCA
jgi:hypothetical protein